jgi:hypothetical protein
VVSVGFLSALVAGYHGVVVAHELTMAESLTRTAFEEMRGVPFPYGTAANGYTTTTPKGKYNVVVHGDFITSGYQRITVTIQRQSNSKVVLVTETNKVQS